MLLEALESFTNEPVRDFSGERARLGVAAALKELSGPQPLRYGLWIDGHSIDTQEVFYSLNPTSPGQIIAYVARAGVREADAALDAATKAFPRWNAAGVTHRTACLRRAAALLRERRDRFTALMILEVGKSWDEADADVAEAIDFLEYYSREALRYGEGQKPLPIEGEDNELFYIPLGVGVVIPPWNFPLAIMTGMTSAALAAGNTVVLKPSSESPAVAGEFVAVMNEAGIAPGALNLVSGSGSEIGDYLVSDRRTRFVAFTGSKQVGLRINELSAKTPPGQRWIKRVSAEMGGKDAIVIAADADLPAAADGAIQSAFSFGGQKCSACSRLIVEHSVYDDMIDLLMERVKRIRVGDPRDPDTFMGPVVSARAERSILDYIEIGKRESLLVTGGRKLERDGYFIEPTIFSDVPSDARIGQEEIFGPVLSVMRARNFDDALDIANDSEFGLTGSVYSTDRAKLDRARVEFHVGNLYLNRGTTGARVGVHPFGGFNMSGTDSKAGGPDYLMLFLQAKTVTRVVEG